MENERKRILELVKQGIISTEEALTLLENISKKEGKSATAENIRSSETIEEAAQEEVEEAQYDYSQGWNTKENPYRGGASYKKRPEPKAEPGQEKQQDTGRQIMDELSQAGEKFGKFLNSAFEQVKDMPIPFLTSTKLERDFVYHDTTLSILEFEIANGNVEFKKSDNDDVKVHANIKLFKEYPEEEALQIFFDKTTLRVDEETLRFQSPSKQVVTNLTVYLPEREYDYVSIKILNGNLHMEALAGRDMFAKTTNGNISVGTLNTTLTEIESINGNVRVNNGTVRDLSLKTFHGNVSAKGAFDSTNLQTKTGNISFTLTNHDSSFLKTKTGVGNIDVQVPSELGVDGKLHTNLGKINLGITGAEVLDETSDSVNKTILFTKLPRSSEAVLKIEAEATTGNVRIKDVK
ncbi:hypothetical protein PWEIH_04196 [Listeria weihenstephanensis FSL R9-0317]|uniref:DUF4097 domain-containing protein n=1 Tax=Listeria weihenstephanensis TaxID=1006155 RepID=A0A1S7FRR5_9LIST|nr:DUF4097 family beta strand repeat-containing protein [Listeria weihenstephanensis]AQY50067.1 hypothetical protein UE46_02720 [Listeria weihenstephanensis]EUJ40431.1 hypothetical protein PWEIH_04196 [Listeria weihenstephanensis FSL R9-0317]MBC1500393.1 DUF4097 domain-containing protein [Listeria weihenstephanensis]